MKTFVPAALAAALFLTLAPAAGHAADKVAGNLTISNPWARASTGGTRPAAAYLTIRNAGATDSLVRATSTVAGRVELHQIIHQGDRARMNKVSEINLPRGQPVELRPGGLHIMLMGLTRQLKKGESFPLSLYFANAGKVDVNVRIMGAGAMGPDAGHDHGHHN